MSAITNPKKEMFAKLFATKQGVLSRVEMVKRSGYGKDSTNERYYSSCASRLLADPVVVARINEIRQEAGIPVDEEDIRKDMVHLLYNIVFGDYTKHMMIHTVNTKTGGIRQCALVKDEDFSTWGLVERQCIQGFDRVNGNPIFLDKMKAFDKLKELVINTKDDAVIEDIRKAYFSAGLVYGLNDNGSNLGKFVNDTVYESTREKLNDIDEDDFLDEDFPEDEEYDVSI